MNEYANDQEQWDAIKAWWKANGKMLVAVIVLGLAVSFGWQFWRQHQQQQAERASTLYDELVVSYTQNNQLLATTVTRELENNFSATPYAAIAALFEAKTEAQQGNLPAALARLQWVIAHTHSTPLQSIARLRAARVLLAQQQFDQALALLAKVTEPAYAPAVKQIQGDIYLAQHKPAAARAAYQAALSAVPATQPLHADLQQQIDQLPVQ